MSDKGAETIKTCNYCGDLVEDGLDITPGSVMFVSWYKCKHIGVRMSKIIGPTGVIDGTDRPCEK